MHVYHFVENQCFTAFLSHSQAVFWCRLSWFTFPLMHRTDTRDLVFSVINRLVGHSAADIIICFLETNKTSCLHCIYDNNPFLLGHIRVAAASPYLNSKSWSVVLTFSSSEHTARLLPCSKRHSVISKYIKSLSDYLFDPGVLLKAISPARNFTAPLCLIPQELMWWDLRDIQEGVHRARESFPLEWGGHLKSHFCPPTLTLPLIALPAISFTSSCSLRLVQFSTRVCAVSTRNSRPNRTLSFCIDS